MPKQQPELRASGPNGTGAVDSQIGRRSRAREMLLHGELARGEAHFRLPLSRALGTSSNADSPGPSTPAHMAFSTSPPRVGFAVARFLRSPSAGCLSRLRGVLEGTLGPFAAVARLTRRPELDAMREHTVVRWGKAGVVA